jgi:hypothetical protein
VKALFAHEKVVTPFRRSMFSEQFKKNDELLTPGFFYFRESVFSPQVDAKFTIFVQSIVQRMLRKLSRICVRLFSEN